MQALTLSDSYFHRDLEVLKSSKRGLTWRSCPCTATHQPATPAHFVNPERPSRGRFGKGDKEAADKAAVDVMRRVLADIKVTGIGVCVRVLYWGGQVLCVCAWGGDRGWLLTGSVTPFG